MYRQDGVSIEYVIIEYMVMRAPFTLPERPGSVTYSTKGPQP